MAPSGWYRSLLSMFLVWAWTLGGGQMAAWAAAEAQKTEDTRLNVTLTLDLVRVPLSDLCQVMERRCGVAHRPADAVTGDLLARVVGTLTVAQLQQALAKVLGVGWKLKGEGLAEAYIVERLPAKRMEEAREQAETDRAFGESLRSLMAAARLPEGADHQAPPRLRRLLENPGRREAFQVLGHLSPAEQAQVFAGGSVDRAITSLSSEGQARVKQMVEELVRDNHREVDESLAEPGGPRLRRLEMPDLENGEAWRIQITPRLGFVPGGQALFSVRVFRPGDFGIGIGWGVPMPARRDPSRYRLPAANLSEKGPPAEPPLLDRVQTRGRNWEEVARDLARNLRRPVVSDAYLPIENAFGSAGPGAKEDSLESYLDRTGRATNRRWGQAGPVLLFQRCDWATLRRTQIPESQARRWKRHIIETGCVALDHLLEMTALTPHQLPNLAIAAQSGADLVMAHREQLQLWKGLPKAQRGALRSKGRVIRDLSLAVQPQARALVSGMLGSSAPLVLSNATLRVEQTEEAFAFSVIVPGRPPVVRRLELTCPPWFRELLRKEEEARVATLRAASEAVAAGEGR
jgi:hypothetical protein